MHPTDVLAQLGGTGDLATLRRFVTKRDVRRAVEDGLIVRLSKGRYALPFTPVGLRAAARLSGAASHESAALAHGWGIKSEPDQPWVIVPRHRRVVARHARRVTVVYRDLAREDVEGMVTSPLRTVLDCARDLPFDRALCVADSALRDGVDHERLLLAAQDLRGPGSRRARAVAAAASALADNPFESTLRAIALEVPALDLQPQVLIEEHGWRGRPDLVDVRRRIVVEADSFAFHGTREGLTRDAHRYNALVIRGWRVVRFTWEQVMFEPDYVRAVLRALVEGTDALAQPVVEATLSA